MKIKKLTLPEKFIYILVHHPESGFGYRMVNVFLKSGMVLPRLKVINSEFLILNDEQDISVSDIESIEPETNN